MVKDREIALEQALVAVLAEAEALKAGLGEQERTRSGLLGHPFYVGAPPHHIAQVLTEITMAFRSVTGDGDRPA
ncbi:hypothetical protein [Pseudomonas sp. RIT-PI-AD]|uniref:hypothetical protein n=1 Tax=Pseudomonas sp. RIT-PI-AD TaxID=3035294 RepID=UPI0021DA0DD7|nr:hypothetical protein [Pseudomonas sp. RIT-PI-AD]